MATTTKAPSWSDLRKMVEWKVDFPIIESNISAYLASVPWLDKHCPTCMVGPGHLCMTGPGLESKRPHRTRR